MARRQRFLVAHKDAKQLGEIARHVLPWSLRRHFERISEFPSGLLPIGDAICRFNPIFGQGISVAAQEAVMLHRLLADKAKINSTDWF
jgi:2-polyprenyl-6-methoxyphenol hydroxylase-like FAD-dependent oxidoreductase